MNRIEHHIVLGELPLKKQVTIYVDNRPLTAYEGEMIAAVLWANEQKTLRYTKKNHPRGIYCGIGRCTDCVMTVDGVPNVRTCKTPVRDGMKVETQRGLGQWTKGEPIHEKV